jgi:hypothetical protein
MDNNICRLNSLKKDEEKTNHCLSFLNEVEKSKAIKLLSREAKMLMLIKNEPNNYMKFYFIKSGLSARWFNVVIKSLVDSGLITKTNCQNDVRGKRLS